MKELHPCGRCGEDYYILHNFRREQMCDECMSNLKIPIREIIENLGEKDIHTFDRLLQEKEV